MAEQVVMVTGGGRGIGRATCVRFGREGAKIVAVARSYVELEETKAAVKRAGGTCDVVAADVGNPDSGLEAVARTKSLWGRLDVLVNGAGVAPLAPFEATGIAAHESIRRVNMDGIFHFCQAAWPMFVSQGQGIIVSVSSIASADAFPGLSVYGASKAWVNALTRSMAQEGRSHGIRAYAIAPGAVETAMLRAIFPGYPKDQCLQPEDVAEAIFGVTLPGMQHASGQTTYIVKT